MVAALGPGRFYGSGLPRPRVFPSDRVDPPAPVTDALLCWAREAHWSMGGLGAKRLRQQGRIEGNLVKLRRTARRDARVNATKVRVAWEKHASLDALGSDDDDESDREGVEAQERALRLEVVDDEEEVVDEEESDATDWNEEEEEVKVFSWWKKGRYEEKEKVKEFSWSDRKRGMYGEEEEVKEFSWSDRKRGMYGEEYDDYSESEEEEEEEVALVVIAAAAKRKRARKLVNEFDRVAPEGGKKKKHKTTAVTSKRKATAAAAPAPAAPVKTSLKKKKANFAKTSPKRKAAEAPTARRTSTRAKH